MSNSPLKYRPDIDYTEISIGEFHYIRDDDGKIKALNFWPEGCPFNICVEIYPNQQRDGTSWQLSGTEENPTLSPSVNAIGYWHGWLKDGVASLA